MRKSPHCSYWVNTAELNRGEIASFLRRDIASMDLWERETNNWIHYPYLMTPKEVMEDHDKEISKETIAILAHLAFVPPQLDPQRLIYNKNGDAFITKWQFDEHWGYLGWPKPSDPRQSFWNFANRNDVLPQSLFYFYLEQEGHGWVLDPSHKSYRNQGPEYCCRSNSRTICRKSAPLNLLKEHLEDFDYDKRLVSLDELWKSLNRVPCVLLDQKKFIYLAFKLTEEKFAVSSKDDQGQRFLQKSFYEAPKKGRKPIRPLH